MGFVAGGNGCTGEVVWDFFFSCLSGFSGLVGFSGSFSFVLALQKRFLRK